MNRLEKRMAVLGYYDDDLNNQPSIYDICLDIKGGIDGSADPLPIEEENKYVKYLEVCLETWEPEACNNILWGNFDYAVRNIIVATLELYHASNHYEEGK